MRRNEVRSRLRAGDATLGCFLGLGSPAVAELIAHAGFDWLVIETEHNALDTPQVEHILRAVSGTGVVPLVRVPSQAPEHIQRALDIGALGVVVPMIRSAEEARAVVTATRYPPLGRRSFGPLRASHYDLDRRSYFREANERILTVLILETVEAVTELEEIANVEGIDALYLGPADLSLALGLSPVEGPHPAIDAIADQALDVGRRTGVAIGTGDAAPAALSGLLGRGFTMISYGPDYRLLGEAAQAGVAAFRRAST
jgi:2-keto-3-deoxy-L-rhamnonate aldolase RhmA